MGDSLHRLQAERRTGLTPSAAPHGRSGTDARATEIRVGSSTNGVVPVLAGRRSLAARTRQWVGLAAVAVSAIAADQLTKWIVSSQLDLGEEVDVVGPLSIHHVQNSGIAFGLFPTATLVVFFARSGGRHPILPVALGFLLGGSVSNLIDRVRLGHVTDFLDLRYWPAFNLADSFIVAGVAILIAALLLADREPRRHAPGSSHRP